MCLQWMFVVSIGFTVAGIESPLPTDTKGLATKKGSSLVQLYCRQNHLRLLWLLHFVSVEFVTRSYGLRCCVLEPVTKALVTELETYQLLAQQPTDRVEFNFLASVYRASVTCFLILVLNPGRRLGGKVMRTMRLVYWVSVSESCATSSPGWLQIQGH